MSNEMTVFSDPNAGELAPEFHSLIQSEGITEDLGGGIGGNYSILSIRGGKFRVKYQGNETPLLNDKQEPVGSVEVVIVKANPYLTKQYYEKAFEEGDSEAPVCFSVDGKVPSASVENPQHHTCALCPMNRFGSRVTPAGVKVKACQDNKKLAIAPLADIDNKAFGGAMLFRVPASALKDLLTFSNAMSARGFPYYAVAVRIGFDIQTSYPKPTFKAIRPLTSEEAQKVVELRNSDQVERLLADFDAGAKDAAPKEDDIGSFEQEPQDAQPKPAAPPPVAKPTAVAAPKPPVVPKAAVAAPKLAPVAAAKAPAATPAPPAARPAAKKTAAPAPAPAPEPTPEVADETGDAPAPDLNEEIGNILAELNATAA